ncbi:hypothetical protein HYFRA_00012813 [Hymenoscyphus fraxineus]|uniref:Uncharacterized protein n=1 Tax=Hymenoscyphus fraxineus TaxID=746836 RepID=A0A9N9PYS3_9HELO|nr:hypothetical protein HYFRA_00012813 [Hymenoscyphus fraxineus]
MQFLGIPTGVLLLVSAVSVSALPVQPKSAVLEAREPVIPTLPATAAGGALAKPPLFSNWFTQALHSQPASKSRPETLKAAKGPAPVPPPQEIKVVDEKARKFPTPGLFGNPFGPPIPSKVKPIPDRMGFYGGGNKMNPQPKN